MPLLPLSSEIVPGLGGSIDADLLKGVAGAIAITGISETGGVVTINYKDSSDNAQSVSSSAGALSAAVINALSSETLLDDSEFPGIDSNNALKKFNMTAIRNYLEGNLSHLLPSHSASEPNRIAVSTSTQNAWELRRGAPPALPST